MDQTQAIAVSTDNVFTSNNSGATWTVRLNVPTSTNFTGCAIYKGLMMVADQANSKILYSTNNGASWLSQDISFPRGCAIAMDGTAYVVLVTGMDSATGSIPQYLLICDNFDPTSTTNGFYSPVYNEPHPFLVALDGKYGVACRPSDANSNKTILYSANFGRTWTEISENITADFSALSISNGYAMVRQTGSSTYYISNNYGQNWQSRTAPNSVTTVANFSDKGTFFTRSGASTFAYNGTLI